LESIYGSAALRPTRIGFLIRPTQRNVSQVREIIRMCTCLWGGMFNPIIPVCTTLPASWRQHPFKEVTGKGLADAYIRFFEPDVFVEAEAGLAKEVGIVPSKRSISDRVVSLAQFVGSDRRRRADFVFGLSTLDIYRDLYQEEFRFAAREKRKVALFTDDHPYCEAVFGAFSQSKSLAYIRKAYIDVCQPESFSATAADCLRVFKESYFTPLRASLHELDVTFENRDDPVIFIFDPNKTIDLIDYWNLRQFQSSVLPINVHWFGQFAEMIRKLIIANFRPLPGNKHGVMIQATIEFARSIDGAAKDALMNAHLEGLPVGSVIRKDWYDPIWRTEWRSAGIQPRRAKLTASEADIEETVEEKSGSLTFPALAPEFASKYSFSNNHARWMNVVRLTDFASSDSRFALTFPPNIKGGDFPALGYASESFCTREGIVLFQQFKSLRAGLRLMSQQDAVIGWFASRGIEAKPSSSGRNAAEVLRAAGGTNGCGLFADEGTVKLLDKMAKTIQREADGTSAQYPDRTASIAEWKEVLGRRSKAIFSHTKLSDFTERNIMRVGLSLACPHCAKDNWFSLSDVDYEVVCERCLNRFSFPQAGIKFNESDWRFRVLGPFSVPNYADGAYATALTLRLFNNTLNFGRTPTTFATGLDVVSGSSKFEIDFAGWYSEGKKFWIDPSPVVVFGETKSFGVEVFKERDVQRLKGLAAAFPGSYVVFSAMKGQLADVERTRIRKFAEWGRLPQKNGEPRAMVIVLTGTELFSDFHLKRTWEERGGAHEAMVKHPSVNIDDLWTLAEITQRLYLGMPSFWEWREQRQKRKRNTPPTS
jgi:hypothetical protein